MPEIDESLLVQPRDTAQWRAWLAENHATSTGAWVMCFRASGERPHVEYIEAVRQALCFGWVDGTAKPYDEHAYVQWFAPRRTRTSTWAVTNKERVAELEASGEMTDAGRAVIEEAKRNGMWAVLEGPEAGVEPPELTAALDAVPAARANWDAFPPSARKFGLTAIALARQVETKASRIAKIVADAAEGRRPA